MSEKLANNKEMSAGSELSDKALTKSDEELVALTLKSQDNFAYLIKRYDKKLLAYILRLTRVNYEEAEDILQDVFIKVYKNLNEFDQSLKFSSWIYRIAHNQVISNFRKNKNKKESLNAEMNDYVLGQIASDFDLRHDMDLKILKDRINKLLAKIDLKYREVLILKYFEGYDYSEISDILKKPVGTIGTLLNRAKKQFINEWKKYEKRIN